MGKGTAVAAFAKLGVPRLGIVGAAFACVLNAAFASAGPTACVCFGTTGLGVSMFVLPEFDVEEGA